MVLKSFEVQKGFKRHDSRLQGVLSVIVGQAKVLFAFLGRKKD